MSSGDETDFVPTAAEDAYPANDYSIAAPEDPVFSPRNSAHNLYNSVVSWFRRNRSSAC